MLEELATCAAAMHWLSNFSELADAAGYGSFYQHIYVSSFAAPMLVQTDGDQIAVMEAFALALKEVQSLTFSELDALSERCIERFGFLDGHYD